jgi:hypothetical protein
MTNAQGEKPKSERLATMRPSDALLKWTEWASSDYLTAILSDGIGVVKCNNRE